MNSNTMQRNAITLAFLLIAFVLTSHAQQWATTDDGKQVILRDDGTWEYSPEPKPNEEGPRLESLTRLSGLHRVIDMAVDSQGKVYALVENGIEIADINEQKTTRRVFDPKSSVWVLPPFYRSVHLAIAVDHDDQPVILWSGRRQDGGYESYLTVFGSDYSVKLEYPVASVRDLAFGHNQNFFVLGTLISNKDELVHGFSASGEFIQSFHPWPSPEKDTGKLGQSSIAVVENSVFVINGFLSDKVYEYQDGLLVRTYDFGQLLNSWVRILISMISSNGKIYVTATTGEKVPLSEGDQLRRGFALTSGHNELSVIEGGRLQTVSRADGLLGNLIGMTPDGRFLATREVTRGGHRFPAVFVIAP
ncbi:hypothetical protein MYX82_08475 [Acidobacteria bacterium AH-259-D05]|nr:hypothetical protein [Acidobacteria bacterium AH-259-D05]